MDLSDTSKYHNIVSSPIAAKAGGILGAPRVGDFVQDLDSESAG